MSDGSCEDPHQVPSAEATKPVPMSEPTSFRAPRTRMRPHRGGGQSDGLPRLSPAAAHSRANSMC